MTRTISAYQIKQFEKFGLTVDPKMSYDVAYAKLGEQFAKPKADKKVVTPKLKKNNPTPKEAPKVNPTPAMSVYNIEVCTSIKRNTWKYRDTKVATTGNQALRQYGIRGTRPRLNEATSKSGKRFRAVKVA